MASLHDKLAPYLRRIAEATTLEEAQREARLAQALLEREGKK